jgi:hypothetical protein
MYGLLLQGEAMKETERKKVSKQRVVANNVRAVQDGLFYQMRMVTR